MGLMKLFPYTYLLHDPAMHTGMLFETQKTPIYIPKKRSNKRNNKRKK